MQGLLGLLFPVVLMLFALAMERIESRVTAPRSVVPAADDVGLEEDAPDVETLATIGLPKAVDSLDLDGGSERRAS